MCLLEEVPVWRALCRDCFPKVPWDLRIEFMRAYRRRAFEPVMWQETMARGRDWFMEQREGGGR
jgi:hypothetical protein